MKIKYQIILSQGLLVVLAVLIIFLNIVTLSSMENDANFINHSGKLRALNYKMAYLSSIIKEGDDGSSIRKKELMASIESYEHILEGLIHGSPELGTRKLHYPQALERLQAIKDLWLEKYKNAYLAANSYGASEGRILILEDVLAYVKSIDEMVAAYSKYSSDKVVKAIYMNGGLILAIIFISAYSFFLANTKIKKPVYELLKELEDMGLIDLILASMSMLFSIAPAEILKGDLHFGHWSKLAEDMGKPNAFGQIHRFGFSSPPLQKAKRKRNILTCKRWI